MGTPDKNQSKGGFFAAMTSGLSMFGNTMHRSVNEYARNCSAAFEFVDAGLCTVSHALSIFWFLMLSAHFL